MNALIDKCCDAFAAVLVTPVGALATVVTGKAYEEKTVPLVICSADSSSAEEDPKGTGNYWLDWTVTVKTMAKANFDAATPADDPKATSQTLVNAVMSALMVDDLPAQLSAAVADFTAFPAGVLTNSPSSGKDEDGYWIDELTGRIYCCASDIT